MGTQGEGRFDPYGCGRDVQVMSNYSQFFPLAFLYDHACLGAGGSYGTANAPLLPVIFVASGLLAMRIIFRGDTPLGLLKKQLTGGYESRPGFTFQCRGVQRL